MNEWSRWSDPASDASPEERRILTAARDPSPPPGAQERVWKAVTAAVGATGMATLASTPGRHAADLVSQVGRTPLKTTSFWLAKPVIAALAKAAIVGSLGGVAAVGWWAGRGGVKPPPLAEVQVPAVSASQSVREGDATRRTSPERSTVESPDKKEPPTPIAPPRYRESVGSPAIGRRIPPSTLEEEARMVHEARTRLQRGDFAGASATLEAARKAFAPGALGQEREALTIEVLWRSGQLEAADRRARAFLEAFPESPHAGRVRRALR